MRRLGLVLSLFICFSCETTETPIPDIGLGYFPLKVGDYQVYSVHETLIDQSDSVVFFYELRLEVIDSIVNLEGEYTYVIQGQKREDPNLPWVNTDKLTAHVSNRKAILTEGNTSFAKLMFPAQNGLEWNGNAFNTLGGDQYCGENKDQPCDTYRLENVGSKFAAGGVTFDETVTVVQSENTDPIVKRDVRSEVYAKGVGLIYKESVVLEYCTDSKTGCLGQQQVDKGIRYKQVLKEHGSN